MIINPILFSPQQPKIQKTFLPSQKPDSVEFSNDRNFNKKILLTRKIIKESQNLDSFFENVSIKIFKQKNEDFLSALKNKEITLSTSIYSNLDYPYSAIGVKLDPKNSTAKNLLQLENHIKNGQGVGINFSEFENPKSEILKINDYFKYREKTTLRAPAGIGLLDINHPKIVDFITLKDNADYSKWCFDLSVVIDDDFMKKVENNDKKTQEIYQTLLKSMKNSGEPGIIFSNKKDYLCDCCATAPLKPNEGLTLGHINLSKFYQNGKFDYSKLKKDTEILSSAMKIIDKNSYIGILGYQDLLEQMGLEYGSTEANSILENSLKTIQETAHKNNIKTAIAPTGGTSRFLKTTPSIEPKQSNFMAEIETMSVAQKYLDGNISKTILLNNDTTLDDLDKIVKTSYQKNLRGISVFNK